MRLTYIRHCIMFDGQFNTQDGQLSIQLINFGGLYHWMTAKRGTKNEQVDNNLIQYIQLAGILKYNWIFGHNFERNVNFTKKQLLFCNFEYFQLTIKTSKDLS